MQFDELTLPAKDYVLVLPGWYPSEQDKYLGDFNQRQVMAAGLYMPQVVLYIYKDLTRTLKQAEVICKQPSENVVEIMVRYPQKRMKWVDAVHSNFQFVRLLFKYSSLIKRRWGRPLLLHCYIAIRGGLSGYLLNRRWSIPYILSEHWTIYYSSSPDYLQKRNFIFRTAVKVVFKHLHTFLPVTNNLKEQVFKLVRKAPSVVVPNVVQTRLFNYDPHTQPAVPFRFMHISTMEFQKNPEGLLRSYKRFNEVREGTELYMVGPHPQRVFDYATSLGISAHVHFTGAVSYEDVAGLLKQSHALVLFSRYENMPCVILEALCCGVPVISTNVGGIEEVINDANGILINTEGEGSLVQALEKMYHQYTSYDRLDIAEAATRLYSYEAVGKLISDVYAQVT